LALRQDSGSCQLLLGKVEFGEQTVAFGLFQALNPVGDGEGFWRGRRNQHAATGRAAFVAGHGLAGLACLTVFQGLDLFAQTPHQREDGGNRHETRRDPHGGGHIPTRSAQGNFKMFNERLIAHGGDVRVLLSM